MAFDRQLVDRKNREALLEFLVPVLDGTQVDAHVLATKLLSNFVIVKDGAVEFHQDDSGEWTGVYFYEDLVHANDNYLAGEFLEQLVRVKEVDDGDFLNADGEPAKDLTEVSQWRQDRLAAELAAAKAAAERALAAAQRDYDKKMAALRNDS